MDYTCLVRGRCNGEDSKLLTQTYISVGDNVVDGVISSVPGMYYLVRLLTFLVYFCCLDMCYCSNFTM